MTDGSHHHLLTTQLKNLFILLFFGAQLYLALPGLLLNRYETQGQFSWNMYSVLYFCTVEYEHATLTGQRVPIDYLALFNRPELSYEVFHRDSLPRFHAYLCTTVDHPEGVAAIYGSAVCTLHGEPDQLVQQEADLCTAPNYGVPPK
jgi:hypothetical protein